MSEHAKVLEPKIRQIQEQLKKITSDNHTEQLLVIINRPGFTTVQEGELVAAMLDAAHHQLEGFHRAQRALVAAAEKIGKAKAA